MTRLHKFRALCGSCEGAAADSWCLTERVALCRRCAGAHNASHERVPLASGTGVCALCAKCGSVPAAAYSTALAAPLCAMCAASVAGEVGNVVPLRDAHAAKSIVFDKMDFSAQFDGKSIQNEGSSVEKRRRSEKRDEATRGKVMSWLGREDGRGDADGMVDVDLSYFKTPVPSSVARVPTRKGHNSADKGERGKAGGRSSRRR